MWKPPKTTFTSTTGHATLLSPHASLPDSLSTCSLTPSVLVTCNYTATLILSLPVCASPRVSVCMCTSKPTKTHNNLYVHMHTHALLEYALSLCLAAFPSQTPVVNHTHTHSLSHTPGVSHLYARVWVSLWEACLAPNCEALLIRALLLSTGLLPWSHPLPTTSSHRYTLCHTLATTVLLSLLVVMGWFTHSIRLYLDCFYCKSSKMHMKCSFSRGR